MSMMVTVEELMCDTCTFLNCYEKGTCYNCKCFLGKYTDEEVDVTSHCDNKTYPSNCPLANGMISTFWAEDGKLHIGQSFQ